MPGLSGYMATKNQRMKREREKRIALAVRETLIHILQRSSIIDTDDPEEIEAAMVEQNKIVKRIQKTSSQ